MKHYMVFFTLGVLSFLTSGYFLVPCWPLLTDRIDPIVSPGRVAGHVHQIVGGRGIAPNMTYSSALEAECTTCFVQGDKSNYWIPALYFRHLNNSLQRVEQLGSASIYYLNEQSRKPANETLEPMPAGLRMIAGNVSRRVPDNSFASQAVSYTCLNYTGTPSQSGGFPTKNCPDGLRAEVTFPSCWNGVELDSIDHKSHVSYPSTAVASGACPPNYRRRLVTLKVEFVFDTGRFGDLWYNRSQPFVWSHGDSTGFGLHADYLMGWKYDLLAAAVDQCTDGSGMLERCPPFTGQLQRAWVNPRSCTVKPFVREDVGGIITSLPGQNRVRSRNGQL